MSFSSTQYKCLLKTTLQHWKAWYYSVLFCFFKTNPASLPFSFHTQSFQSDSTSFDMRYKMRARASGVNGDKGRKGERRRKYYLGFFVQVVVAVCICQNIECLTG